jgi:hypothetical protein
MTRRIVAILFFSLFLLSSRASAQNDLALSVGGNFTPDSNACILPLPNCNQTTIKAPSRTAYEATLSLRILGARGASLSLEVPVMGIPARGVRSTTAGIPVPRDFSSVFLTPSVRLRVLSLAGISPFVSAGVGFAHYRQSKTLTNSAPNPNPLGTNAGAFQVGGGVDLKTPLPHVALRAEVRDFVTGRPSFGLNFASGHQENLFLGGGIVLRF